MKKISLLIFLFLGFGAQSQAVRLADEVSQYEVLFTNPICRQYVYPKPVESISGELLYGKPKNAYCTSGVDSNQWYSKARPTDSPQKRIIEWISNPNTKEVFLAFLSFSNTPIGKALCRAADHGVQINFVMDVNSLKEDGAHAERLLRCGRGQYGKVPRVIPRGHTGSGRQKIGWAHNKVILINPGADSMRLVFGSGNLSNGPNLHHENWHFLTLSAKTYFAQSHLCLMAAQLSNEATINQSNYTRFMESCRARISYPEESDAKVYFIPNPKDSLELMNRVSRLIEVSDEVNVAAHRISSSWLLKGASSQGKRFGGLFNHARKVNFVGDDDLYWLKDGLQLGPNTRNEYANVMTLLKGGARVGFIETNHESHQLHHNKYIIGNEIRGGERIGRALLTGAANLTDTAFGTTSQFPVNFENIYWIEIPQVLRRFNEQYAYVWQKLATPYQKMPKTLVIPIIGH